MTSAPRIAIGFAIVVCSIPGLAHGQCLYGWASLLNQASNGRYYRWPECYSIPYTMLNVPSSPSDVAGKVRAGFAAWDALSDHYSFDEWQCAFTSGSGGCGVVAFEDDFSGSRPGSCDFYFASGSNILTGFYIHLNTADYAWTTTCEPTKADVLTVVLHEIGHAIAGLNDIEGAYTASCPTVMKPWDPGHACWTGTMSDDAAAIAEVYPSGLLANRITTSSGSCDINTAAEISDFRIVDNVATWSARHEWQTKEYVLEGCYSPSGAGVELVTDRPSLGTHVVPLAETSFPFVRLVEVESSGRRVFRAYDVVRSAGTVSRNQGSSLSSKLPSDRYEPSHEAKSSAKTVHIPRKSLSGDPTIVVYSTPELVAAVLDDVAPFWEEKGHVVEVVDVAATFPPGTELGGIKASIANHAATGAKYFHLVGDWEDDYPPDLWASDPYWQSKYDAYQQMGIIPTHAGASRSGIPVFRAPDHEGGPNNTAITAPYIYTDQWYADTDNDDIPDVVVTRWPFREADEVAAAAERLPWADVLQHPWQRAQFLVGDAFPNGTGSIAITKAMVDELAVRLLELNPDALASWIYESDFPDYVDRNSETADFLNWLRPELIIGLATFSDRHNPCRFFYHEQSGFSPPGWDMGMLDSGFLTRLVLAASCHSAEWVSPECVNPPCYGPAVCDEFLSNDGAGALAWIGPTAGSLQGANSAVARNVLEELMYNPYRPMAESWLVAMRRAYSVASADYLPTLMSYAFLGDPLSPFRRLPDRSITAKARRTGGSEVGMPAAFAVGCPQSDRDKLVVEVSLDAVDVLATLPADAFTISQPVNGSVIFFPENTPVHADSTTSLVAETGQHRTTFTVSSFSGCGVDSALVSLYGIPLGYAHLNVKSYDVNTGEYTHGVVNLPDFAVISGAFVSSQCDCVYAKDYEPCVDYAMPDTTVNLVDLAEFWPHYGHEVPGGGSSPEVVPETSAGTVLIEFEEAHPLIGEHRLRAQVSLEGVEPFELAVFALHNTSPKLEFLGWTEADDIERETICMEAERDGRKEVVIGVLRKNGQPSSAATLGTAEFRVLSDQQLVLGEEDLALVTADLLSIGSQRALAVSSMDVRRAVSSVRYENALAQNYPNPCNPTTTISFSLARSANANLSIYDVRGSLVRRLVDERKERGIHRVVWDGMNGGGQQVASGVYFYKLVAGTFADTKKMIILK